MLRIVFTALAALHSLHLASSFNLYIDEDFGVNVLRWATNLFANDGPLYFIRDDKPYAPTVGNDLLQFITIQTTNRMRFTWDSDPDERVDYSWTFSSTNLTVLGTPYLTINHTGIVPKNEVFFFVLPCTGVEPRTETAKVVLKYSITQINGTSEYGHEGNTTVAPQKRNFTVPLATRVNCVLLAPTSTPVSQPETDDSTPLWVIGVAVGAVLVVIVIVVLIALLIRRKKKEGRTVKDLERELTVLREAQETSSSRYMDIGSDYSGSVNGSLTYKETVAMRMQNASRKVTRRKTELVSELKEDWFEKLADCIVELEQVKFEEQLGQGAFGFVFKGTLSSAKDPTVQETVALKTLKNVDNVKDMSRFLSEGIVMKDFHHPNVMGLTGVCFPEEDPPIIILPYMANGDLHTFLKKRRGSVASMDKVEDHMLSTDCLMEFVMDICYGMEYLSSQKFVHRDLAARNCMLDKAFVVKIGDFGLAKEMHEDLYYRLGTPTKLPVKWMAVESLNDQVFTTQTDVWSFGVTMWEVMSQGRQPYPGVANHELAEHLMKGHRLQKPEDCTDELFEIMATCWKEDATNRPTFSQLVMMLGRLEGGQYVARRDEPDGYENFSPIMQSLLGNIADQNSSTTAENEIANPMKNGSSVSSDSKCVSVASPTDELDEEVDYLPMSLKSSTLDASNKAAMVSPDDSGGDYLMMALSPQPANFTAEESRGHSPANESQLSLVHLQQQSKEDVGGDDREYMRMVVKSSKSSAVAEMKPTDQPIFSVGDGEQDEYMKMTAKGSKSDNGIQQTDDRDCEYMTMVSKNTVAAKDVARNEVQAASNTSGEEREETAL